ncbi:MAG: GntR family transcriptional regulator [Alphaproteobacteria bacterium]
MTVEPNREGLYTAGSVARAYEAICDGILSGRYPAETHLRESSLAEEIGVSRTPVREALRQLAAQGFVVHLPNQGTFVRDWSPASISDLTDMRAQLGVLAARLAAARAKAEDIVRLRTCLDEMHAAMTGNESDRHERMVAGARIFFDSIFALSGNGWLLDSFRQTTVLPIVRRTYQDLTPAQWARMHATCHSILDALAIGDAEWAAASMHTQFMLAKHALVDRLVAEAAAR